MCYYGVQTHCEKLDSVKSEIGQADYLSSGLKSTGPGYSVKWSSIKCVQILPVAKITRIT